MELVGFVGERAARSEAQEAQVVRVYGVDSGGTCGIASWHEGVLVDVVELEPMEALDYMAWDLTGSDHVACESFIPRPGVRTWQPDALEVIGALRYVCYRRGASFELQSPADAKRFSTNEKLKKLGWYHPTPGGHANDGLRHLLLALVRLRLVAAETLL